MKNFTYYRPANVEEAIGLLDAKWGTSELLAGGTDLLDLQKEYVAQPLKVISLTAIPDFEAIKDGAGYRIGAGTKLAAIAEHEGLQKAFPALTTAASIIGGPQIRNMGTLGGNLCQRNRCWYFRDEHVNCLLKGGSKCFALDGENRYHAVFTQGQKCVIVNPSTLAPALIALGATAEVQGPKGKRTIELAKFFKAPSAATEREHALDSNEIVLAVILPDAGLKNASYEVRQKQAYDWPLVQAAVAFKQNGGNVSNVKIVLGHVAPTPYIADAAAKSIEGKPITEETATAAGQAAAQGAKPLSQNGYKIRLIEVAVKRALLTAAGGKKYWEA
ncbi:MAG TPA: xanthine dehydrogenase family protein subunit M [Gemmataceae bacterium]|jgi:xanthine dehydrogenase YagS FAD-binding subunit|nr:xanthine dehydrogenase family protein subunit M [Gemmataceae bacterium]